MKWTRLTLAALAVFTAAQAKAETFNLNVAQNPSTGNLYFGTGNPNGNFAVATNGDVTLGLRADYAFGSLVSGTMSDGTGSGNYYTVQAGTTPDPDRGNAPIAKWDFVYSLQTQSTDLSKGTVTASITVTGPGGSQTFNPLLVPDNGGTATIAQNAENIVFGGGDPTAVGLYEIDFTADNPLDAGPVTDIIFVSYCQKSWMKSEPQAASLVPSLKITPAITAGSNVLPLSFRQWF